MKILLHICCGVCAGAVAEKLMIEGHRVTGYFYNPNIHPVDEYQRRLEASRKVATELGFDLVEGPYDRQKWFELVKGLEYAPEGGDRCRICYRIRLEQTYKYMREKIFGAFTTTLSVSPHKDAAVINSIGREIGGEKFINADFKKKGGFLRATEMSREMGLYRQDYCGCVYSQEEALRRRRK
ncbi:MAG: recombinase [Candidatus Omnitrophica bacterium]|nr:recombinase [Candidatus Omnitrophota bacterium]